MAKNKKEKQDKKRKKSEEHEEKKERHGSLRGDPVASLWEE